MDLSRRTLLKGAAGLALASVLKSQMANAATPKVVSVYDAKVTTYDSGLGWGSTSHVNQSRLDAMVAAGVKSLTGQSTEVDAWTSIIPTYNSGVRIGIKVNENNGGTGPSNNVLDWLPQLVNAVIKGLKVGGFAEPNIYILEPSTTVPSAGFGATVRAIYPNIVIWDPYGSYGNSRCTFTSADSSLTIHYTDPNMTDSKYPDQMLDVTYFVHMPQLKAHGAYGVTFVYKNLLGMLVRSTIPRIHDYIFNSSNNPLVDLYANPLIINKTRLVVGDGIYGNHTNNWTAPSKWSVFGNSWPKRVFFAFDPVAHDCVMYDFVDWQNNRTEPTHENYLINAAARGHGVRDHWSNPTDKRYSLIDFVQLDMENPDNVPPSPPKNLRILGI